VSIEELWLGFAAVRALSVPPTGTVTVDDRSGSTSDGDGCSRDGDKRTGPFLVTKGGCAFKDDLKVLLVYS
jgi:hypothetical protein